MKTSTIITKDDFKSDCKCGRAHQVTLDKALIADDALFAFDDLLHENGFGSSFAAIYDENTYAAMKGKGPRATQEIILDAKELHADERGVKMVEDSLKDAELLVAVGAGTIHDITRFIASKRKIPFASVPTAASVDGFVSSVAAMTLNGFKTTVNSVSPKFLIADLEVISKAPSYLTASGFGDVLGKYISLADWEISTALTGEYYCEYIANLTKLAVEEAVDANKEIASGNKNAYGILMKALVLSGIAMQLSGNSRPASGAEHHVSHLIEMGVPWLPQTVALHGEKVGIGTLLCLHEYKKWIGEKPDQLEHALASWKAPDSVQIVDVFGALASSIMKENAPNCLSHVPVGMIEDRWEQVQAILCSLPSEENFNQLLKKIGGKTLLSEIGIDPIYQEEILRWSPYVRNRLTFMRLIQIVDSEA